MNDDSRIRAEGLEAVSEIDLYSWEVAWTPESGGAVYAGGGRRGVDIFYAESITIDMINWPICLQLNWNVVVYEGRKIVKPR